MDADTVLAAIEGDRLSSALASLHRAGHGPNVRVLDAARGDLGGQLRRAGIADPPAVAPGTARLLMVFAPNRVAPVVDLLQRAGSTAIYLASRGNPAPQMPVFTPSRGRARAPLPAPPSPAAEQHD